MPQLDKVTLFSQVFWLLFLYFFFFLIFLKYYLPNFSKLFKVRYNYLTSQNNLKSTNKLGELSHFSSILSRFNNQLKTNLLDILNFYSSEINLYNFTYLKKINNLFIVVYIYNCLKFNLYKKLYL